MAEINPKISVIIPTYNRKKYLLDTLQSLTRNTATPEEFEIIVVNNNSDDNTQSAVTSFIDEHSGYQIRHVIEKKQGASYSRNRGINEARAPVLLFVDDDETADEHLIQSWISFFGKYPNAVGGGGRIEVEFEDPRPNWMSHFLMPLLGEHEISSSIIKYPASKFPFAGNMAFRKQVFEQYGKLKTDLGRKGGSLLAGEEKEFYKRLRKHTDQIYHVPKAKVYHRVDEPRMTKEFIKKQAVGLGQTIRLMLENESILQRIRKISSEFFKSVVTLGLFIAYTVGFKYPKAKMLLKFRWWIWKGYWKSDSGY